MVVNDNANDSMELPALLSILLKILKKCSILNDNIVDSMELPGLLKF